MPHPEHEGLTDGQIQNFISDGFVRLDNAFSADLAARCRDELWSEIGLSPHDPKRVDTACDPDRVKIVRALCPGGQYATAASGL